MIGNTLNNTESIIIFIAVLSILIIVHEWGHFITAKRLGVKVQRFALGFGPTLYSKLINGTNYMINIIPLGGYVKMAGDERSECKGTPDEFFSQSVGRRSLIVVNGPVVNFVLAYLTFVIVFMLGYPGQSVTVAGLEKGGPAQVAGLQPGDQIVAIDSKKVYGWLNLEERLKGDRKEEVQVTVVRDGEELTRSVMPDIVNKPNIVGRSRTVKDLGISNFTNVVGVLTENYPAMKAGILPGDRIIAVDNARVSSWTDLQSAIANSIGDSIEVKLLREEKTITMAVVPKYDEKLDKRVVGIGPQHELDLFRFNMGESVVFAAEELMYITKLTYESIFRMLTGALSARESVAGPVGIFYIVKGAAESGLSHLLFILGFISASLAIFNLLPIIPLDGGHLFLFAMEKVRGRALSPKIDEVIARTGFSLIVLLALFIFYVDFARMGLFDNIGRWFDQVGKFFS